MQTTTLFDNGRSQAVRLPKAFRFSGEMVYIKKMGHAVILLPMDNPWESLFHSLTEFSDDFMETREQPAQQIRKDIFK